MLAVIILYTTLCNSNIKPLTTCGSPFWARSGQSSRVYLQSHYTLVLSSDFAKRFMGRRQSPKKISDKTTFPYNPRADLKINSTVTQNIREK